MANSVFRSMFRHKGLYSILPPPASFRIPHAAYYHATLQTG